MLSEINAANIIVYVNKLREKIGSFKCDMMRSENYSRYIDILHAVFLNSDDDDGGGSLFSYSGLYTIVSTNTFKSLSIPHTKQRIQNWHTHTHELALNSFIGICAYARHNQTFACYNCVWHKRYSYQKRNWEWFNSKAITMALCIGWPNERMNVVYLNWIQAIIYAN